MGATAHIPIRAFDFSYSIYGVTDNEPETLDFCLQNIWIKQTINGCARQNVTSILSTVTFNPKYRL